MCILYHLSLQIYILLAAFASLFNQKARLWIKGRRGIFQKISAEVNPCDHIIWFHAASLGEFEQGRPVIEMIKENHPQYKILLTFFSPSGYEVRKNYEKADYIFYLPADSKRNAHKFIQMVNPKAAIFIKYEFWYNYLTTLQKKEIPTFIISAIFRKDQVFFQWYGGWYRKMLHIFTHLFVQNKDSENLLASLGIRNVTVAGDTRFDRVYAISKQALPIPLIDKFKQGKPVLVIGSSWEKDEEMLIEYMNTSSHDIKYIIAPHEVKPDNIKRLERAINLSLAKYSVMDEKNIPMAKVLIIDCIGILSSAYQYGEIAYIGGGFGNGIHNILEAATFGMPVIFGPNYKKFNEACELIKRKSAFSVKNFIEIKNKLDEIIKNKSYLDELAKISENFVKENLGSSSKILEKIEL